MPDRRLFAAATAALPVLLLLERSARAETFDIAAILAAKGPLPEKSFGDPGAPVTIVEYASLSCGHCMRFHLETWPKLKLAYVDTGKVRFIMREFPLDPAAFGGFMLARCAGDEKWYAVIDTLYRTKEDWGHADNPGEAILQTLSASGLFTRESFETCLRNEDVFKGVQSVAEGARAFGVSSTPTFFINGRKAVGALTFEQMSAIIEPLLKG